MNLEITVKNYRCFSDQAPAKLLFCRGTTALIGGNNTGKSTLLRLFYEFRPLFSMLSDGFEACSAFFEQGMELPPLQAVHDRTQIFHRHNNHDLVIGIRILRPSPAMESAPAGADEIFIVLSRKNFHCQGRLEHSEANSTITPRDPAFVEKWSRVFQSLSRTLYIGPFRGWDELTLFGRMFDLPLDSTFSDHMRKLHDSGNGLNRICDEIKALFHLRSIEINPDSKGGAPGFLINGVPTPMEEMGSGLLQAVMILVHARSRQPDYVFIDEPEAHLHVSLQADFVTTLSGFARVGLIFASHNPGLAKSAGDRIYQVRLDSRLNCTTLHVFNPGQRLSEVLGELNFSAQEKPGCTKLLLVEGPTEIKAIRQILKKMRAEREIILLPLGGGSMITANRDDELAEIKKICPDVYALIDSEKISPQQALANDRLAFKRSCEKADIACHVLERRSFENYFSEKSIQRHYGKRYRALGAFDDVKERYPAWQKSDNWKIIRDMDLLEIENNDLGRFLHYMVNSPCKIPLRRSGDREGASPLH